MKVVVTGASGNIGTALLRRLDGVKVHGVSRRPPAGAPPYRGVEWAPVDIARAGSENVLAEVMAGADAVVHLAWEIQPSHDERQLHRANVGGSERVFRATVEAGVPHLVHMSSVGAYAKGPKNRAVDESWPVDGVTSSYYSRQKAAVEHMLDRFERDHPALLVTRPRPGLVLQPDAGAEIKRYFLGPLVPRVLFRHKIPLVPLPGRFVMQFVHTDDVADALVRILDRKPVGAVNIAADPVVTPQLLAQVFGGRRIPLSSGLMRGLANVSWRLRLQPTSPGWVDLALAVPVLDSTRARTELGWHPRFTAVEALRQLLDGLGRGAEVDASPVL